MLYVSYTSIIGEKKKKIQPPLLSRPFPKRIFYEGYYQGITCIQYHVLGWPLTNPRLLLQATVAFWIIPLSKSWFTLKSSLPPKFSCLVNGASFHLAACARYMPSWRSLSHFSSNQSILSMQPPNEPPLFHLHCLHSSPGYHHLSPGGLHKTPNSCTCLFLNSPFCTQT